MRSCLRVGRDRPPRAIVQGVDASFLDAAGFSGFEIRESAGGEKTALVLPDIATCPDCLGEMRDPADRRYRYPFTNCTNCGPRFTIIEALPYDRPNTTMAGFPMCAACQARVRRPARPALPRPAERLPGLRSAPGAVGRRMVACRGWPTRRWRRPRSAIRGRRDRRGEGTGRISLVVDARSEDAVRRLRQRKAREEKPFALMFPSLDVGEARSARSASTRRGC